MMAVGEERETGACIFAITFYDIASSKRRRKKRLTFDERAVRGRRRVEGCRRIKIKAVVGGKHLKSSPHCLLYTRFLKIGLSLGKRPQK